MPALTAAQQQKLLLEQEISKLSGVISRHAPKPAHQASFHPYPRGHNVGRGNSFRGRGNRGRGSGKSYNLDLRSINKAASNNNAGSSRPATPQHSGSVDPDDVKQEKEAGEVSPSPPSRLSKDISSAKDDSWVKATFPGSMSLMTAEKSKQLQSRPRKKRVSRGPPRIEVLTSSNTATGPKRVTIDGVIFQFEQDGKKLARVGEVAPTAASGSQESGTPTRRRLDYDGQQYRRTSKGNLVSAKFRVDLPKKPCRYFTKTGRCTRALTCPFAHDPSRVAICPRFLRSTCPLTAETCPLSHSANGHNTPSCVHFQATSSCRNGVSCPYPHIRVSGDAPVCEAFAREGWCDKEEGTCPELHVWECGEWRKTGTCSRGVKCGLQHILRAERGKGSEGEAKKEGIAEEQTGDDRWKALPVEGGFEDQAEYIDINHNSPQISSSEEEDPSGESDDSAEEGDDSEEHDDDAAEDEDEAREREDGIGIHGKHDASLSYEASSSPGPDFSVDTDEADEDAVLDVVA